MRYIFHETDLGSADAKLPYIEVVQSSSQLNEPSQNDASYGTNLLS